MAKPVFSKDMQKALREFKKAADAIVKRIAAERDALRALVGEYEEVLDSLDEASEDFAAGLDRISSHL